DAPATFPLGTTTVTWTVTDNAGNTATATQVVTVVDVTAPVVTAPADVVVNTNFGCQAIGVVIGTVNAVDNCTISLITNDAPMIYPLGVTVVTWAVFDNAGNVTTVTQNVEVVDNEAPTITLPANVEVSANSGCDATGVILGTPITADNCGVASVVNDAPSVFPSGTTIVTWTVTDNSGNQTIDTQLVTVTDLVAPIAFLTDITIQLPVGQDAYIDSSMIDLGSSDNCSAITFDLSQTSFDCGDVGNNYIVVTITDQSGNSTTATVNVTVQLSGIDSDYDGIDDACDDEVKDYVDVPNGFTPDGDGYNDYFVIPGITDTSSVTLTIYNRYGNLVYQSKAYNNDWDGTSSENGMELPDGTYFYVLEMTGSDAKSGYVYINRVY
ncbi:MAG: gliding motility-associated C-terminal domain-containing protein, partial [Crocinitomicaceae bacterium]